MRFGVLAAGSLLAFACSSSDEKALTPLAQEGEKIYQNVCIACHNGVPSQDGAIGPAIAGASRELIEAKVLRGEYPPGYAPKRPGGCTAVSVAWPPLSLWNFTSSVTFTSLTPSP